MNSLVYSTQSTRRNQKDIISEIFFLTTALDQQVIPLSEFERFLQSSHDMLIEGNSSVRASILRVLRMTIEDEKYVDLFIKEEFPFVVVSSFEREGDYAVRLKTHYC